MNTWTARLSGDDSSRPKDHRDPFQRDKARILHSAAFRRLQSKTQVLSVGQHDFYRTRLTHSLEVAQIGTGLTAQLRQRADVINSDDLQQLIPSDPLIEALCLAHDLGHPPFGHGGEIALNYMMANHGGFEGNGQTFRIISLLEPYTENFGMDLTRRTCLGLLKYPTLCEIKQQNRPSAPNNYLIKASDWTPQKAVFVDDEAAFNWVLADLSDLDRRQFTQQVNGKSLYKSFDASIMEIADDIAYAVHDLEDAIVLNYVTQEQWQTQALPALLQVENLWSQKYSKQLSNMLFSHHHHQRKQAIGALVNHLVTNIEIHAIDAEFEQAQFTYNASLSAPTLAVLDVLKGFVFNNLIMNTEIQQLEFRGQRMLMAMFDAFASDPERLLPQRIFQAFQSSANPHRIICDYLASMSDQKAIKTYHNLFAGSL